MAVRFLLDEQMDPTLAGILRQRGIDAVSMQEWHGGSYLHRPDEEILAVAEADGLTLITYDVHTIPPLLGRLAESETAHAGVVLISFRTIESQAIATLARAIERLVSDLGEMDWRNRVVFLPKP